MKGCCVCILDLNQPKLCGQLNVFTWKRKELRLHKSFFTTTTSSDHQYWNSQLLWATSTEKELMDKSCIPFFNSVSENKCILFKSASSHRGEFSLQEIVMHKAFNAFHS